MLVFALDLGNMTGWALGDSERPDDVLIGHWDIYSHHKDLIPGNLGYLCRVLFREHGIPDFIAIEQTLDPSQQKNRFTVRSQERLHGAALGVAGIWRIPKVLEVYPATVRKHFCGRPDAGSRAATKLMVMKQAKMVGYKIRDDNEGDAVALFDFIVHAVLKQPEKYLRMFVS